MIGTHGRSTAGDDDSDGTAEAVAVEEGVARGRPADPLAQVVPAGPTPTTDVARTPRSLIRFLGQRELTAKGVGVGAV